MEYSAPEVGVDEESAFPLLHQRNREIRRARRLAVPWKRARDDDCLRWTVGVRERDVGPQIPIRLTDWAPRIAARGEPLAEVADAILIRLKPRPPAAEALLP